MKLNTYIFPSSIICFCFLKLMCLCSWQWFLCTFLCLLVAVNQGVLKTGHTVEASRETWCGEVVTWSRNLSSYFVGGFQRSSQKPAGQDFECCRQNLMVGSEGNRKPEWLIGILKLNRGPWLFSENRDSLGIWSRGQSHFILVKKLSVLWNFIETLRDEVLMTLKGEISWQHGIPTVEWVVMLTFAFESLKYWWKKQCIRSWNQARWVCWRAIY